MENEASRMSRLIDDLLSLSSVEVDEHVQPREPVNLIPLLSGVVNVIQAQAVKKGSGSFLTFLTLATFQVTLTNSHRFFKISGKRHEIWAPGK